MQSLDLIICTYNNVGLLDRTLGSILKQQVKSNVQWGILVVNNNCTDHTSEVVAQHQKVSPVPLRMTIETRQGLTPARACGVRETTGDWIAFIDDDCLMAPDWVDQAVAFAHEHPACGAFGSRILLQWEIPPPPYVLKFPFAYAGKHHGETSKRRPWLAGLGMVVRRSALEASGWTHKQLLPDRTGDQLVSGGDVELSMRIASKFEVWYNPECLLHHIIPQRRFTRPYLKQMLSGLAISRHHTMALSWQGSYPAWLAFTLLYAFGIFIQCIALTIQEFWGPRQKAAGPAVIFATFWGWNRAIRLMWQMTRTERQHLLGGALEPANI